MQNAVAARATMKAAASTAMMVVPFVLPMMMSGVPPKMIHRGSRIFSHLQLSAIFLESWFVICWRV